MVLGILLHLFLSLAILYRYSNSLSACLSGAVLVQGFQSTKGLMIKILSMEVYWNKIRERAIKASEASDSSLKLNYDCHFKNGQLIVTEKKHA
jgi:hypothetical protein